VVFAEETLGTVLEVVVVAVPVERSDVAETEAVAETQVVAVVVVVVVVRRVAVVPEQAHLLAHAGVALVLATLSALC
jgi:hypothetical protein